MLLGPQDLLVLRDDIILYISSLFVEVIKESLISDDKIILKISAQTDNPFKSLSLRH